MLSLFSSGTIASINYSIVRSTHLPYVLVTNFTGADTPDTDEKQAVFPFAKPLAQLQEQIVAPETHVVYAVTWYAIFFIVSDYHLDYVCWERVQRIECLFNSFVLFVFCPLS